MATEGFVKFEYYSKGVEPFYSYSTANCFPELLDDENIVIQTPNLEMSFHQYYGLFKKFLMSVGFSEKNIIQGACHLAFNDSNDESVMKEVAEEYDLIMSEQLPDIIADRIKQDEEWIEKNNSSWEQRYWALYRNMQQSEKKINETMPPWGHSDMEALKYTDEELEAMCDAAEKSHKFKRWDGLIPGSPEAKESGCLCPVLDNQEMPDDKKWIDVECPIHGRKK